MPDGSSAQSKMTEKSTADVPAHGKGSGNTTPLRLALPVNLVQGAGAQREVKQTQR